MMEESFFVLFPDNSDDRKALLAPLAPVFENNQISKIGHDLKADLLFFLREQIPIVGPFQDTMLSHYLLDADTRHSLDLISENTLGYYLFGEKEKVSEDPLYAIALRACEKAEIILQLHRKFEKEGNTSEIKKLLDEVELPLMEVLAKMEFENQRSQPSLQGV